MLTCDILISAAHIITQNEKRELLINSAIAIKNGTIIDIGQKDVLRQAYSTQKDIDFGNALLMPGLINTHTHVSMTYARGIADDLPLMQWLQDHMFPLDKQLTKEIVEIGAMLGFAEMLRTGTTTCLDMSICAEKVFHAAERTGIRCTGGETIFQFPSFMSSGSEATFDIVRALADKYQNHSRLKTCVTPHAVYTTTPKLLEQCVALSEELHLPLHMHLSESCDETLQCLKLWNMRPVELCRSIGMLKQGTSFAHVVDVTEDEIALLAKNNVSVAHNPSSNMKLASGVAPIATMRQNDIRVGVATDGACSNNRLNMFTEMRESALLHKVNTIDPTIIPAQEVLDMATREGAKIIAHFENPFNSNELGVIDIGCQADLIALNLNEPHMQPMYNPVSHLVYVATGMEVEFAMVEGEVLYHNRKFPRFDYDNLMAECKKMQAWVLKNKA